MPQGKFYVRDKRTMEATPPVENLGMKRPMSLLSGIAETKSLSGPSFSHSWASVFRL